jgi:hypothetical protein
MTEPTNAELLKPTVYHATNAECPTCRAWKTVYLMRSGFLASCCDCDGKDKE